MAEKRVSWVTRVAVLRAMIGGNWHTAKILAFKVGLADRTVSRALRGLLKERKVARAATYRLVSTGGDLQERMIPVVTICWRLR